MLCLNDACVFDGVSFSGKKNIYISDGKIEDISSHLKKRNKNFLEINVNGSIVAPGFIDIQLNGGGGCFFNEDLSIEGLKKISEAHLKYGTTSFLPTLITDKSEKIGNASSIIQQAINEKTPGILGIHFEGPFLNLEKKGIHPPSFIRSPIMDEIKQICSLQSGIKLVTLAPEKISKAIIQEFIKNDVIVFAGHTNATYKQTMEAFSLGVKGITHLFNACSQFGSREAGVVGASLQHDDSWSGIIADGLHVGFDSIRLALKAKAKNKFILVSDAMPPVGTDLEFFYIGENKIFVKDGKCVDEAGTLAGCVITVYDAFKNIVNHKLASLEEALCMASTNAAECLGIDDIKDSYFKKGRVLPGFDADLVILNKETLVLEHVVQAGNIF